MSFELSITNQSSAIVNLQHSLQRVALQYHELGLAEIKLQPIWIMIQDYHSVDNIHNKSLIFALTRKKLIQKLDLIRLSDGVIIV